MKIIIKFGYLFIFINLFSLSMSEEIVKIITWRINSDDQMEISYYLHSTDKDKTNQYYVIPMVSVDNGQTWFKLASLEGNYGLQTSSRSKKMIFWDIFNDRDKLVGDVRVKLIAKQKISIFEKIFSISKSFFTSSQNIYEWEDYRGMSFTVFNIDFPNSTYEKNINQGVIEQTLGIGMNMERPYNPFKVLTSVRVGGYDINQPVPYIDDNELLWVVSDSTATAYDSNGLYNSNEEVEEDDFYSFTYQSASTSILYPLPLIRYVTPFLGLGVQFSRICLNDGDNLSWGTGPNSSEDGNFTNTSDLFWIGSIDLNSKSIIVNITYQQSIFRQLKKWNELSVNVGIKLAP